MCKYFNLYDADKAEKNLQNIHKYGTANPEEIQRIEEYAQKVREEKQEEAVDAKIAEALPAIQEQERENARKVIREEYRLAEVAKILELSPFISESVTISGKELYPNCFIPDKPFNEPVSEETKLYPDDENDRWMVRVKNGLPKFISKFVVIACFIVDASGPGSCRAYVVFLKGEAKPLIFWEGVIDPAELRKQTQFHKKGLSYGTKDLYHQSFLRALRNCNSVYFHSLPKHAGWNRKPDGSLIFVDSAMMKPEFEGLFLKDDAKDKKKECNKNKLHNIYLDISLVRTERKFGDVKAVYHTLLPDTLPIKIGTVISAMSRFLPFYKEEGLEQDRLWVVETADDATAKAMTVIMQNRNNQSIEALFSSKGIPYIENEVMKYVDCVMIIRHSTAIGSKYKLDNIQELLYEVFKNTFVDDSVNRMVPVLIIDNAGVLSEELPIHQLSLTERLCIDDYEQAQRILGELDYCLVKYAERNPDTMAQRLETARNAAKEMVVTLPRRSQSNSAVMFIATALMLKEDGILTEADVQAMLQWLSTEAKSRTSMGRNVCKAVGTALSNAICNGRLPIAKQYGPPYWACDKAFVAVDDSLNVNKKIMEDELLSDVLIGRDIALKYLKDEDVLFTNKGEDQKTWTVETEDGKRKPRRFYSFSRDLLTSKADRIVDEAIASDLFHKQDEPIDNFFPFIKHRRLDMVAGQLITD